MGVIEHHIVAGAAVRHIGNPVAASIVIESVAAGGRNLDHIKTARSIVCQHHSIALFGRKWEGALKKNVADARCPADGDGVETIGDRFVIRNSSKTGVDGKSVLIHLNVDCEGIGRRI